MGIPKIRERLHELADTHGIQELHDLAEATRRKKPLRPYSKKKYSKLCALDAVNVKTDYLAGYSMHDLALLYGTNIGRVSEAVNA